MSQYFENDNANQIVKEYEDARAEKKILAEEMAEKLNLSIGMHIDKPVKDSILKMEILSFNSTRWTNQGNVVRCSCKLVNSPTGYCTETDVGKDGLTFRFSPN